MALMVASYQSNRHRREIAPNKRTGCHDMVASRRCNGQRKGTGTLIARQLLGIMRASHRGIWSGRIGGNTRVDLHQLVIADVEGDRAGALHCAPAPGTRDAS